MSEPPRRPPLLSPPAMILHAMAALALAGAVALLAWRARAPWFFALAPATAALYAYLALRRPLRLRRALEAPFPEPWRALLLRRVRFYRQLDEEGRGRFERNLRVLASEQRFEAVAGAEVTDEVRVLALAGAAVLVHGWEGFALPAERTLLIYPDHFDRDYTLDSDGDLAGMVHAQGPIVFSRRALELGWRGGDDGYNVAIHEFAHVLDLTGGDADGMPGQLGLRDLDRWGEVMRGELERVRRRRSPLDSYAGTDEAELFAVATETFFEKPSVLRRRSPELYALLSDYFAQDPASRSHPDDEEPGSAERRRLHRPERAPRRRR